MNESVGSPRGWLSRTLSLLGAVAIGWSVIAQYLRGELQVWFLVATIASLVAWLVFVLVRPRGRDEPLPLLAVMVLPAAISAGATNAVSVVIAAIGVLWLTRDLRRPIWWGITLGLIAMTGILIGNVLVPSEALGVLSMEAGIIVAFLAGESRRQFLLADIRSHELIEEQAQTDVLAARQQLAHDIHDVLAHSLGGLVIQLDAVDALLDSGDTEAAAAKVKDARTLAAEGLGEARRAVAALSTPDAASDSRVEGDEVAAGVEALIASHRSLGGSAKLLETGRRLGVRKTVSVALRRAVQEGLTNARKHAPGKTVTVTLAWTNSGVTVEIANPVGDTASSDGGGHGLVGMRDRFAALPGGAVTSGVDAGRFVVTAKASAA